MTALLKKLEKQKNSTGTMSRQHGEEGTDTIWTRLPFYETIGGQQTVQRYLEPLMLFILGIITSSIHGGLATFFYMGGISLFIKGYVQAAGEKQRILDIIDQQIEAEQITRAVTNWQDPGRLQTEGVVIPAGYAKYSESRQREARSTTDNLRAAGQATIPLLQRLARESRVDVCLHFALSNFVSSLANTFDPIFNFRRTIE